MYLERVPTKRVFDNKHSMRGDMAVSENIHPTQRRGSASRAHGMSFTEINLPADQVISVHTEALVKKQSTLKEVIEDEKQREKTVADRVYDAVPGGVPAVLDLMRSDPRHAELQWWCADAIASLTVGKADNQAKVIELGGAQLVLAAMERFPDNENVASKGMWAITNVAATQATALGELGAIHAVLVSVKLCPTFEVQSVFIRALGNLIHGNDANLHTALAEGAKKAVRSVAADNAGSGQLLYRAGMLMQALGGSLDDDDDDEEEEEEVVTVVSAAAYVVRCGVVWCGVVQARGACRRCAHGDAMLRVCLCSHCCLTPPPRVCCVCLVFSVPCVVCGFRVALVWLSCGSRVALV